MKLSYLVTVHNEYEEIKNLLQVLLENKRDQDEIVVLQDNTKLDKKMEKYLLTVEGIIREQYALNSNFAEFKNYGNSKCTGDYIFQIDADEFITSKTMELYVSTLEDNADKDVDLLLVPRINTVDGITDEHIQKWGWKVNPEGWINFPDYQWRVYKNDPEIKWMKPVHEIITGYKTYFKLPPVEAFCLYHKKTISKQEQQNEMYSKIGA